MLRLTTAPLLLPLRMVLRRLAVFVTSAIASETTSNSAGTEQTTTSVETTPATDDTTVDNPAEVEVPPLQWQMAGGGGLEEA